MCVVLCVMCCVLCVVCDVCCVVFQCTNDCGTNTFKHAATRCNKLQDLRQHSVRSNACCRMLCFNAPMSVGKDTLEHTATHCNTLQHTATAQRRVECLLLYIVFQKLREGEGNKH